MFSFIPPVLIVLSIAGIIFIVLRKSPEVTAFFKKTDRLRPILLKAARRFWHFVLEVKGLTRYSHFPKTFPKIHLPKTKFPFLTPADSVEAYLDRAQESFEKGDFQDAERKFIKAIEKDPHNEEAFDGLGKLYLAQKKNGEAIETYKFLTKHYPKNDGYFSKLGQSYHSQKLYDQAVEAYEQAIALSPDNANRYVNLGLVLEAKKHLEEAILNYRKAVDLENGNTHFLMVLAEALMKKDEREEAESILEKILQLEPTNHLAREKLMQLKF